MKIEWQHLTSQRRRLRNALDEAQRNLNTFPDLDTVRSSQTELAVLDTAIKKIEKRLRRWRRGDGVIALANLDTIQALSDEVSVMRRRRGQIRLDLKNYKQTMENVAVDLERQVQLHRRREIFWAAQSEEHLRFVGDAEPSYLAEALKIIRQRWPQLQLNGAAVRCPEQRASQPQRGKRRRRQPEMDERASAPTVDKAWTYIVLNDSGTKQWPLSSDGGQAEKELTRFFKRFRLSELSPGLVLSRLTHITSFTAQRRSRIKVSQDTPPVGWKIWYMGCDHRAFLNINENTREIKFIVRPRAQSYNTHGHRY